MAVNISKEIAHNRIVLVIGLAKETEKLKDQIAKAEKGLWIIEIVDENNEQKLIARPGKGEKRREFLPGENQAMMAVERISREENPDAILFPNVARLFPQADNLEILRFVHQLSAKMRQRRTKTILFFSEDTDETLLKDAALFCDKTIRI